MTPVSYGSNFTSMQLYSLYKFGSSFFACIHFYSIRIGLLVPRRKLNRNLFSVSKASF